jgi:hypothetical protein
MPMSSGKYLRSCAKISSQGIDEAQWKLATCPFAWTPASVLPLPEISIGSPRILVNACSSFP